jgi:DNA-binding PadR family transcriptional regulator
MLAQGDLKLLVLALIAEQPRHGYEIIKVIEEKTSGWYSPSPGVVYPTLTYLEEAGYLASESEGSKKLYRITPEGESYLKANRDIVDVVLDRLAIIGRKMARMRRAFGGEGDRSGLPQVVGAAIANLGETAGKQLEGDAEKEAKIVEILMRAANDIKNA